MAAKKGTIPPAAGKGRAKGSQNKLTQDLKSMILGALDEAGGQAYLVGCAKKQPKAFLSLLARVLPMQVTGEGGGPIETIARIELVAVKPKQ